MAALAIFVCNLVVAAILGFVVVLIAETGQEAVAFAVATALLTWAMYK